ncbi:protein FAM193A-like [Pteronotus mesoamericanus]|uniref:protein FAM193A-like n=1 Tax=Pteronotus mesoamericanus TaxID=1884717 RepID=UPI0023EDBD49|nr:protein FAM193A-like [Pteronotus parnellii mesoamericanus]
MSRANAKGGAKRRKNKRGGGGGGGDRNQESSGRVCPKEEPCSSQETAIMTPGAVAAANRPFVEGVCGGGEAPRDYWESPLNLSETQGAPPYPTGVFCALCKTERKDGTMGKSGVKDASKLAPEGNSMSYQTQWVCLTCRWTLGDSKTYGGLDQPAEGEDLLAYGPLGGSLAEAGGESLAEGAQSPLSDTASASEACFEPMNVLAETDLESQRLQDYWSEVRFMVRFIYHQTGTLVVPNMERLKELVDRLCRVDPSQLYQRLDHVARDFVLDMKIRLLQPLYAEPTEGAQSCTQSPRQSPLRSPLQAQQFICCLLKEYGALCQSARAISTFLVTLENEHLSLFDVTWELHNKHLFENLIFSDRLLQSNLPALMSQIRLGATTEDICNQSAYRSLLKHCRCLEEELHRVARKWVQSQKRVSTYVLEKMTVKTKLTKALKRFKQTEFLEEHLTDKEADTGENNLAEALRYMLSSPLAMPDRRGQGRSAGYDCDHSHVATCSSVDPPVPSNTRGHQQALRASSAPDCLSESHQPIVSLASSGSGSSSPVITQQQLRPIRPDEGSTSTFCTDSDVAALSAKFADIYLVNSDDIEVVPYNDDDTQVATHSHIEVVTSVRSETLQRPEDFFYDDSFLALPAPLRPDSEEQFCNKGASDPQQGSRDKSANNDSCSEHSSRCSSCSCTYNIQEEHRYCECCGQFYRHDWPSATPTGRSYEEMREKLRLRLARRKEEQPKKTDRRAERQNVVDHRTVEDLLQFINTSETKPVSSTRRAKRERHKQRKLEEKAHMPSGSLEQTEKLETSSHSPSRREDHTGSGAHGDSKLLLPKETPKHQHKDGTGKKLKQTGKSPKASEGQPKPRPQTQPNTKVLHLVLLAEQRRLERKARSENKGKKRLSQVKEKASLGPEEPACPTEPVLADTPQPSDTSKENRKGDGDNNPLYDVFMPKDIDLDSEEMDETEREVEHFKRFCLDSARQTRQRLSIDWSNFSLKKPHFLPPK